MGKEDLYICIICVQYFLFNLVIAVSSDVWFFLVLENKLLFCRIAPEGKRLMLQHRSTSWTKQKRDSEPKQQPYPSFFFSKQSVSQSSVAIVSHHTYNLMFTKEAARTGPVSSPSALPTSCSETEVSVTQKKLCDRWVFKWRSWNFENALGMRKLFPSHFW